MLRRSGGLSSVIISFVLVLGAFMVISGSVDIEGSNSTTFNLGEEETTGTTKTIQGLLPIVILALIMLTLLMLVGGNVLGTRSYTSSYSSGSSYTSDDDTEDEDEEESEYICKHCGETPECENCGEDITSGKVLCSDDEQHYCSDECLLEDCGVDEYDITKEKKKKTCDNCEEKVTKCKECEKTISAYGKVIWEEDDDEYNHYCCTKCAVKSFTGVTETEVKEVEPEIEEASVKPEVKITCEDIKQEEEKPVTNKPGKNVLDKQEDDIKY